MNTAKSAALAGQTEPSAKTACPDAASASTFSAQKTGDSWGQGARAISVYVHFPYCLSKCPYCDFLSIPIDRGAILHEPYADAVVAELEARVAALGSVKLSSVFFGGGTPSLWNAEALGRTLRAIFSELGSDANGVEVTVECNPSSFNEDDAHALVGLGVNRVSIGVQSLDERRLKFLGRLHGSEQGLDAVRAALRAGVPRVSADLIFGVAGQTPSQAVAEALAVAETGISHLSAYALTIEPGTRFGVLARDNRLPLADEAFVAESFVALDEALARAGFEHYEISNYAREGHFATHNLGYWRGHDYLGLGCGAWGTVTTGGKRLRYRNTPSIERYLAARTEWRSVKLGDAGPASPIAIVEPIDPNTALAERILLGLRLAEGVDVESEAIALGVDPWPASRAYALRKLTRRGRIERRGSRLVIPKHQWLFADATIAELI